MDFWNAVTFMRCVKELIVLALFLRAMDSSCKTLAFRSSVVIALASAVATILYYTPLPEQYPQSCSRPCHELDWPMICRVKLTFERYQTMGSACKGCPDNGTECYGDACITVDGQARGILTANRQFPGPILQVCQHDIMVVDVVNRIPGQSFGVHWRGQPQSETPYMDGVPMITQCPIPGLTTFQYKFRASKAGTHAWQVNTGEEVLDTLFGPFIVRRPDSKEVHRKLYDTDDMANVVVIHPWNPRGSDFLFRDETSRIKLLINGKTQENKVPSAVFKISQGMRHRFRTIYMGNTRGCQIRLTIDKHQFLVIALDGHSIKPKLVTSVRLFPGERLDFVLRADQQPGRYYMRATPMDSCKFVSPTQAVIEYGEGSKPSGEDGEGSSVRTPEFTELLTTNGEDCLTNDEKMLKMCINDITAAVPISEEVATNKPEAKFYFFYTKRQVSRQSIVNTTFVATDDLVTVPQANNLTMMLPSSPLLSQGQQLGPNAVCNSESIPDRCRNNTDSVCECVHVVDIPLDSMVELILVNQDKEDRIFHLHGYSFRVIGVSKLSLPHLKPEKIKYLDEVNKLVKRNLDNPVIKDTVAVISNSVAVLRFKADNPGYWLLDEELGWNGSKGMSLVLHVGKRSNLAPIPKNFPKCGDWIGPEFFLV